MDQARFVDKMASYCRKLLGWIQQDPTRAGHFLPAEIDDLETAQRCFQCVQAALESGAAGNADAVVEAVEKSLAFAEWPAPHIVLLWEQALGLIGRDDRLIEVCRTMAERAAAAGDYNLSLEAYRNLLIEDLHHGLEYVGSPTFLQGVAAHCEEACSSLSIPPVCPRIPDGKIRIGLVVPLLPSVGPPFARRALHFAKYLDEERYELFVYSTEGMSQQNSVMPSRWQGGGSLPVGQGVIDELTSLGATVHLAPPNGGLFRSAATLALKMAQDELDAVIIQSGLSVPNDWLSVRLAPVPVKLHIHIGVSNYLPGLDYTLFDNRANMEREAEQWPAGVGDAILMRRGTDLDAMDAVPAGSRSDLAIPEDAVVIGALSNNFDTRLSEAYCAVLCEVMQRCPNVWYLPVGSTRLTQPICRQFVAAGVADRVRHISRTFQSARELNMMNIYASEFPSGGSQSVVEALACSLPVVAMRCADTHYESISADIAGPSAIIGNHPSDYRDRLIDLVQNPELRRQESLAARRRAERLFSISQYVSRVAELAETVLRRKCGEAFDERDLFSRWREEDDEA